MSNLSTKKYISNSLLCIHKKGEHLNYYNEIKDRLIKSEIYDRAKDYSKDEQKKKLIESKELKVTELRNEYVIRYCTDERIIARKYKMMQ